MGNILYYCTTVYTSTYIVVHIVVFSFYLLTALLCLLCGHMLIKACTRLTVAGISCWAMRELRFVLVAPIVSLLSSTVAVQTRLAFRPSSVSHLVPVASQPIENMVNNNNYGNHRTVCCWLRTTADALLVIDRVNGVSCVRGRQRWGAAPTMQPTN